MQLTVAATSTGAVPNTRNCTVANSAGAFSLVVTSKAVLRIADRPITCGLCNSVAKLKISGAAADTIVKAADTLNLNTYPFMLYPACPTMVALNTLPGNNGR